METSNFRDSPTSINAIAPPDERTEYSSDSEESNYEIQPQWVLHSYIEQRLGSKAYDTEIEANKFDNRHQAARYVLNQIGAPHEETLKFTGGRIFEDDDTADIHSIPETESITSNNHTTICN